MCLELVGVASIHDLLVQLLNLIASCLTQPINKSDVKSRSFLAGLSNNI